MQLDKYPVFTVDHGRSYEFFSQGPKGAIKKVIRFQSLGNDSYNLAFGDWDEMNQKIDDSVRSNNEDRNKVLATVALTVLDFVKQHPQAIIFAQGSTPSKTRLYQMGIAQNRHEIQQRFVIMGIINNKLVPFNTGINYEAFVVTARENS